VLGGAAAACGALCLVLCLVPLEASLTERSTEALLREAAELEEEMTAKQAWDEVKALAGDLLSMLTHKELTKEFMDELGKYVWIKLEDGVLRRDGWKWKGDETETLQDFLKSTPPSQNAVHVTPKLNALFEYVNKPQTSGPDNAFAKRFKKYVLPIYAALLFTPKLQLMTEFKSKMMDSLRPQAEHNKDAGILSQVEAIESNLHADKPVLTSGMIQNFNNLFH